MKNSKSQNGSTDLVVILLFVVAGLIGTAAYVCVARFMAWLAST